MARKLRPLNLITAIAITQIKSSQLSNCYTYIKEAQEEEKLNPSAVLGRFPPPKQALYDVNCDKHGESDDNYV